MPNHKHLCNEAPELPRVLSIVPSVKTSIWCPSKQEGSLIAQQLYTKASWFANDKTVKKGRATTARASYKQ
jgi:hypothetical protein